MDIQKENTVGEVVAKDFRLADVFENHEIDFCCNGHKTIADACTELDVNTDELIAALKDTAENSTAPKMDYNSWPLDLLADYIEKTHHRYAESAISKIKPYLEKICQVHGEQHPELHEVNEIFAEAAGEFASHMKKEELMLFPRVRKMVEAQTKGEKFEMRGSAEGSVEGLMHDHDNEGDRLHRMEALTNNYTVPEDGCNTYELTFSLLKEFDADMHKHIHLENNILFPKALKLEKELQ